MIYALTVPAPIEEAEEVRVLEWHFAAGDEVRSGDLVVELETHKALVEVRAAQAGWLRQILCSDGGWSTIGEPLAILSDRADEAIDQRPEDLALLAAEFDVC